MKQTRREVPERRLANPAIGLNHASPINLLQSGIETDRDVGPAGQPLSGKTCRPSKDSQVGRLIVDERPGQDRARSTGSARQPDELKNCLKKWG
jgi:hypothetical protein